MELQGADVGCISHFFYTYDKIQDKSSPKKVYMGSQFEVAVHHGKQGEVAGPAAPEVRKQRTWMLTLSSLFPFYLSGTPAIHI